MNGDGSDEDHAARRYSGAEAGGRHRAAPGGEAAAQGLVAAARRLALARLAEAARLGERDLDCMQVGGQSEVVPCGHREDGSQHGVGTPCQAHQVVSARAGDPVGPVPGGPLRRAGPAHDSLG